MTCTGMIKRYAFITASGVAALVGAWLVVALVAVGNLAASTAAASPKSYAPWQILASSYDSATRVGRMCAVPLAATPANPNGSTLMMLGADNGGTSRSTDLGVSWSNVNGGRGFSDSFCGGYSDPAVPQCTADFQAKRHGRLYGGPPSSMDNAGKMIAISDVVAGPVPDGVDSNLIGAHTVAGAAQRAGIVYRASFGLFFSPDAARQWYPLAPQCSMLSQAHIGVVAADRGLPGHLVVGSLDDKRRVNETVAHDTGGCPWWSGDPDPDTTTATVRHVVKSAVCGPRAIAWTSSVGAQMNAVLEATQAPPVSVGDGDWTGAIMAAVKTVETAGGGPDGWRYAGLNHLGASRMKKVGGVWKVEHVCALTQSGPVRTLVPAACKPATGKYCHGAKPSESDALDMTCPMYSDTDDACHCLVLQACEKDENLVCLCKEKDSEGNCIENQFYDVCNFPEPQALEIDPRNGYVYASTDVGLLVSPDGGQHWQRFGQDSSYEACSFDGGTQTWTLQPAQERKDPDAYGGTTWPGKASRGAKLLTHQNVPGACVSGAALDDGNAFDLNAHPEYIIEVGRMSLAWKPCSGDQKYSTALNGAASDRQRGSVVATLNVRWRDPLSPGQELSSVFAAINEDSCACPDPTACPAAPVEPGALVFRDTRGLLATDETAIVPELGNEPVWTDEKMTGYPPNGHTPIKLPRWQERHAYEPSIQCRVRYYASAVAPSDDRIIYAWAYSEKVTSDEPDPYEPGATSCAFYSGLWRSLDRGRSWHIAAGLTDPQAQGSRFGQINLLSGVDLSVSPHNPYRVMVTGSHRNDYGSGASVSVVIEPASQAYSATTWPAADCRKSDGTNCPGCVLDPNTSPTEPNDHMCTQRGKALNWATTRCRKDMAHPDICELFKGKWDDNTPGFGTPDDGKLTTVCKRNAQGLVRCARTTPIADVDNVDSTVPLNDTAPPQCLHVPPWQQATTFSGAQMAVADVPEGTPFIVEGVRATLHCQVCAGGQGEVFSTGSPPEPCCLVWRSLLDRPDPASSVCSTSPNNKPVVSNSRTRSLGHSGGSVQDLAITAVPGANPAVTPMAPRFFLGMDDNDSGLAGTDVTDPGKITSAVSDNAVDYTRVDDWKAQFVTANAGELATNGASSAIRALVAVQREPGEDGLIWALSNLDSGVPAGFLRLIRIDPVAGTIAGGMQPSMHVYPTIVLPPDPLVVPMTLAAGIRWGGPDNYTRGGIHARIVGGPPGLVFVSATGVGVFAVATATLPVLEPDVPSMAWLDSLGGSVPTSDTLSAVDPKVAFAIPFSSAAGSVELRPCVTDLVYSGGYLFATVGRRTLGDKIGPECADVTPGLYRAKVAGVNLLQSGSCPPTAVGPCWDWTGTEPSFELVSAPPSSAVPDWPILNDAQSVAVDVTADGQINLLLGDWAPPGTGQCRAALWLVQDATKTAPTWRVATRMDRIGSIAVAPEFPNSKYHHAWFTVDGPSPMGWDFLQTHVMPSPGDNTAKLFLRMAPLVPGVFRLALPGIGGAPAWMSGIADPMPQGNCDEGTVAAFGSAGNPQVAPCHEAGSSECVQFAWTPPGGSSTGIANAVVHYRGVAVSSEFTSGVAVGSLFGQGAYWLPPPVYWPSAIDPYSLIQWTTGGVPVAPSPSGGTAPWQVQYADLYQKMPADQWIEEFPEVPDWLRTPVAKQAPQGEWQYVSVPASAWRNAIPDFAGLPGDYAMVVAHDALGPTAIPTAQTGFATFSILPEQFASLALGRASVRFFTDGLPDGTRLLLNDVPFGAQVLGASAQSGELRISGITAALRHGENRLAVACPPGSSEPCTASFLQVETALGVVLPAHDLAALEPAEVAEARFPHMTSVLRRHGAWLVVKLTDASVPTTVSFNGGEPVLVQAGLLAEEPATPTSSGTWRILLSERPLRRHDNIARFAVSPCLTTACPARANLADAFLLVEYADDLDLCIPSGEQCGDGQDDDCDGSTDESGGTCDGADRDGCRLGRATCGSPSECVEAIAAPTVTVPDLLLDLTAVDAIYADGSVVALSSFPSNVNVVRTLQNGATIDSLWAELPPSGNNRLLKLVLHVAAGSPRVTWGASQRPVELRSEPTDSGSTLTFELADDGTIVEQGQHLILIGDNTPGAEPANQAWGCPDGTLTYPARVTVRNACDWPGVDCQAAVGAGAACDSSDLTDPVYGDADGCRHGHYLPLGSQGALVCAADDPTSVLQGVMPLTVTLATATVIFDHGDVSVAVSGDPFELRNVLAAGQAIPGLLAPEPPVGASRIMAVRLVLAHAEAATVPDPQDPGQQLPVTVRSGEEDSGLEIDIVYADTGTVVAPGQPIAARAAAATMPDWAATWQCWDGGLTVRRRIMAVNPCDDPGGCP